MKNILILTLVFILFGCAAESNSPAPRANDPIIFCANKQDESLNITYYKSDAKEYVPQGIDIKILLITDVKGKKWSVNEYEMENYVCQEQIKTGQS